VTDDLPAVAKLTSDDTDGEALYIWPMPNGDWYIGIGPAEHDTPRPESILRVCTSGSAHGDAHIAVNILYRLLTEDYSQVQSLSTLLASIAKARIT